MCYIVCFFLMIRRPPRSTLDRSSAASDVYKRQVLPPPGLPAAGGGHEHCFGAVAQSVLTEGIGIGPVSYTHLRAHETVLDLVCRLLLEKQTNQDNTVNMRHHKHSN